MEIKRQLVSRWVIISFFGILTLPLSENDVVLNGVYTFEAIIDAGGYRKIRNHPSV